MTIADGQNEPFSRADLYEAGIGVRVAGDNPFDDLFRDLRRGDLKDYAATLPKPKTPRKPRPAAVIKQLEQSTGKRVTGVALAADGGITRVTFGEPSPSEAPSALTADDELERWRRKHAR